MQGDLRNIGAMSDTLSREERSDRMARVRAKDTGPELIVRRLVHRMGYRYRLHDRRLPGCPDLVFASRKKVIQVNGCFWHRHSEPRCRLARVPKSRLDFWLPKLQANAARDERNLAALRELNWDVLTIWECQLNDHVELARLVADFLESK